MSARARREVAIRYALRCGIDGWSAGYAGELGERCPHADGSRAAAWWTIGHELGRQDAAGGVDVDTFEGELGDGG